MATVLSDNAQKVLAYVQANDGADITYQTIADALEMGGRSVSGTLTGLVRKGLVTRDPSDEDPKVKFVHLTDEGKVFDPATEKDAE